MSKKFLKSFFIKILLAVLVLSTLPSKSIATSTTIPIEDADSKIIKTDSEQNSNLQTGELVEERTANTKTFYNGDGKYTKKIYFEPIHMKEVGEEKL